MNKHNHITCTATLLTLLLIAFSTAVHVQASYGGSAQAPSGVTIYSFCGSTSQGLLFAVGTNGTHGLIYRITDLDSFPTTPIITQPPGKQYDSYSFHTCEVVGDYLFAVGEGVKKGKPRDGLIFVYSISNPSSPTLLASRKTATETDIGLVYRDVEVKLISDTYYIYTLSVLSDGTTILDYAPFSESTIGNPSSSTICSGAGCNGYGISMYGDYLGVLWRGSFNNLYLSIYSVSSGSPVFSQRVTVLQGFTSGWASVASYSKGFLVVAEGGIYRVYFSNSEWVVEVLVENAFSGNAYAVLVAENSSAIATYVLSQASTDIYISAVDLVKKSVAYVDTVTTTSLSNYGDATVIWVDSNNKIVSSETPSARPVMLCGAIDSLVYYDLTRGGGFPYPVPEPWLTSLAVVIVTAVFMAITLRRG